MGYVYEDLFELLVLEVDDVIRGVVEWSFWEQYECGYWVGMLELCCQLEVEFLMCLYVLGIEFSENKFVEVVVCCVCVKQCVDGVWDIYLGVFVGDINIIIESYIVFKLYGVCVEEFVMVVVCVWILVYGGIFYCVCIFIKLWLVFLGEWLWDDVLCLLFEFIFLLYWVFFSVYQFSYWVCQVIVLMVIFCVWCLVYLFLVYFCCCELICENELLL